MRLALSVFKDSISTVFDAADQFLIIEMDGTNHSRRISEKFLSSDPVGRTLQLKNQSIDVLICGAISRPMHLAITSQGITIYPFIKGNINDVLAAHHNNQLAQPVFLCRAAAEDSGEMNGEDSGVSAAVGDKFLSSYCRKC